MSLIEVLEQEWAVFVVIGLTVLILTSYAVRTLRGQRYDRDHRAEKAGGSVLLSRWLMEAFYTAFSVPGRLFIWLGVAPDTITWLSLLITACSAPAAALGHFSIAGMILVLGSLLDSVDGMVARKRGLCSDRGEMLDAVLDRYADAIPLAGLVIYYRFSVWQMCIPFALLVGAMLLSYVRAKAEAMDLDLPGGLMRRQERLVYLVIALVVAPELSRWLGSPYGAEHPVTLAILAAMAILCNFAAFQLLFAARRELTRLGRGPKEAHP